MITLNLQYIQILIVFIFFRPGHPRQEKLTQAVCNMVLATFVPTALVDAPEFRDLMELAEPQFKLPTRNTIRKHMNNAWPKMKTMILEKAAHAVEVHFTADEWSTRACNSSCLGVTLHFFDPVAKKRESFPIACRHFPSPQTGERIADMVKEIAVEFRIFTKLRWVYVKVI
jgi:hypothetical protein